MVKLGTEVRSLFVAIGLNATNLGISFLTLTIVPRFTSVLDFSYWQLYVFYTSLTVLFHFGVSDGVYIACGGKRLTKARISKLSGELVGFVAFTLFLCVCSAALVHFIEIDETLKMVVVAVIIAGALGNVRSFLASALLADGRLVAYSWSMISTQVVFGALLVIMVFFSELSALSLFIFDLIGRVFAIVLMLVSLSIRPTLSAFRDFQLRTILFHARTGFPVLLSYLVNMLSTSSIRFTLLSFFDLITFGKVSLMMSVVRLLTVFSQTFSLFLFPILKKMDAAQSVSSFRSLQKKVSLIQSFLYLIYFPISSFIGWWLVEYAGATIYLAFLLPAAVFEFRTMLLHVAFIKAYRLQSELLRGNLLSAAVILVFFIPAGVMMSSLSVILIGLACAFFIRSFLLERAIERAMSLPTGFGIYLDAVLAISFTVITLTLHGVVAFCFLLSFIGLRILGLRFSLGRA